MPATPLIDYLGLISTAPPNPMNGDMVIRSPAGGWTTINPGSSGTSLSIDPLTGLPTWEGAQVSALPAASSAYRGVVLTVQGGSSTADVTYVCLKSSTGTYSWKQLATG